MVKNAYEDTLGFDKEAAPRWRKEWGNLSPEAQKKMRESIASQANETAKRMRGGSAIMDKLNMGRLKIDKKDPFKVGKDNYGKGKVGNWLKKRQWYKKLNMTGPAYDMGNNRLLDHMSEGENGKPNFKGLKRISRIGKRNLKKTYKEDPKLYNEIKSILQDTHEVGGEGISYMKYRKKHPYKWLGGPQYFSHISPEVLHRESASVATASPKAQEFMKNLRTRKYPALLMGPSAMRNAGYKWNQWVSEADDLKRYGGIEYGKDAVVNMRKVRKHKEALGID